MHIIPHHLISSTILCWKGSPQDTSVDIASCILCSSLPVHPPSDSLHCAIPSPLHPCCDSFKKQVNIISLKKSGGRGEQSFLLLIYFLFILIWRLSGASHFVCWTSSSTDATFSATEMLCSTGQCCLCSWGHKIHCWTLYPCPWRLQGRRIRQVH